MAPPIRQWACCTLLFRPSLYHIRSISRVSFRHNSDALACMYWRLLRGLVELVFFARFVELSFIIDADITVGLMEVSKATLIDVVDLLTLVVCVSMHSTSPLDMSEQYIPSGIPREHSLL